jgi:hypothetical protein
MYSPILISRTGTGDVRAARNRNKRKRKAMERKQKEAKAFTEIYYIKRVYLLEMGTINHLLI